MKKTKSQSARPKRRQKPEGEATVPETLSLDAMAAAGVDMDEAMSIVCNNLDKPSMDILEILQQEFNRPFKREQPYEMLRRAAAQRRLHYIAPLDSELSVKLLEGHEWLRRARVVRTTSTKDVARHAALLLLEFVRNWEKSDLHMGIAGGGLMAETIRFWADFLKEASPMKLSRLFVHALVAATDDPRRSPNGFVQYLLGESPALRPLPFRTEFVGLPAPAFLRSSELNGFRKMEGVRDAFAHAASLDLVVTSAGAHWDRGCSGLNHKYKEVSPESVTALSEAGCIGDVIWQPFGPSGPLDNNVGKRAVTLLDLNSLPPLVASGARVMLVLAPCGGEDCGKPKNEMLAAVLGWRNGVTDVVVDAEAAAWSLRR